jgi:hypothetical protein
MQPLLEPVCRDATSRSLRTTIVADTSTTGGPCPKMAFHLSDQTKTSELEGTVDLDPLSSQPTPFLLFCFVDGPANW